MEVIPFFPIPAPGETVYSALCRYAERSGLSANDLLSILAGNRFYRAVLSPMTGHISHLSQVIPYGHPWRDAVTIVRGHTTLPYYIYFLPVHERERWISLMVEDNKPQSIFMSLALTMYPVPPIPPHPQYCPQCVFEQEQKYGFSFYKREHQLPGVLICSAPRLP